MDRNLLKRYLEAGMSLPQIGALTNRHPSTVGYWVKKHGLAANGRRTCGPRGALTRKQLEPLVEGGATAAEIAQAVDRSISTVHYWLKKHGLELVRKWRTKDATEARRAGRKRFEARCANHGWTEFLALPGGRSRCARCNKEAVAEWRRRAKRKLVAEAGGRCVICGYDRWVGAMQFHHLDPEAKSFGLAMMGVTRSIDRLREEAAKCVLLCSNCHAEVEGGISRVP